MVNFCNASSTPQLLSLTVVVVFVILLYFLWNDNLLLRALIYSLLLSSVISWCILKGHNAIHDILYCPTASSIHPFPPITPYTFKIVLFATFILSKAKITRSTNQRKEKQAPNNFWNVIFPFCRKSLRSFISFHCSVCVCVK